MGRICRVKSAVNHWHNFFITRKWLSTRLVSISYCITHSCILDVLDGSGKVSNISCGELIAWDKASGSKISNLNHLCVSTCGHELNLHALSDDAISDSYKYDNSSVGVVDTVKDKSLKGRSYVTCRSGNLVNNCLKDILYANSVLG